jgi:DedD protein
MERQKIFWVVLSVSVLVVVVLVVGVMLLRPRSTALATVQPTVSPAESGAQIYEYQREQTTAAETPQTGDEETMHFYIGEGGQTDAGTTPQDTGAPETSQPATQASEQPSAQQQDATQQPAAQHQASTTKPVPAATQQKQATTKKVTEYWIQAGAYKSQARAEQLATVLTDNGLTGRIFSSTQGSDTFYRVRIGPYTTKGEAEKFLGIVKKLQGLQSSYISQVMGTRTSTD